MASMRFMMCIVKLPTTYYYYQELGEVAMQWEPNVERWNDLMHDFKICQPCRAYSKTPNHSNNHDHRCSNFLVGNNGGYNGQGNDERGVAQLLRKCWIPKLRSMLQIENTREGRFDKSLEQAFFEEDDDDNNAED
jgi:hypothetical protein